jgi:hypothetical protein
MRLKTSSLLFLASTMLCVPTACKTTEVDSGVKDSNFSKADPAQPSIVLWLASDGMVHYGSCPVGSTVVDRNCPNLTEPETPIKVDDYKEKLTERLKLIRPKSNAGPATPDAAVAQALQIKIDRIKAKMAAGGLSDTEKANFQKQLDVLQQQYTNAQVGLTVAEQADLDKVMKYLEAGQDVTYDEGERLFGLALSPFSKGASSYRLVFTANTSSCSNTIVVSELSFDLGSGMTVVTIPSPGNVGTKESAAIGNQTFEIIASSIYSGSNAVSKVIAPNGSTGWAPKGFLNSSGAATSLEFLQFDFPLPVAINAIAFSSTSTCQPTEFHVESSIDATTFLPIPNAQWKGVVYQGAKQTFNW